MSTEGAPKDDGDRRRGGPGASDLRVGFYIDPQGKPRPSLGARFWAAEEIARILGPDEPSKPEAP